MKWVYSLYSLKFNIGMIIINLIIIRHYKKYNWLTVLEVLAFCELLRVKSLHYFQAIH